MGGGGSGVQIVVEQGLEGTGAQRARRTPEHETGGETEVGRKQGPGGETGCQQGAGQDEQVTTVDRVGPGTGRDLQDERGRGPDGQQGGDLGGVQAVRGEQQRVEGIQRNQIRGEREEDGPEGQGA